MDKKCSCWKVGVGVAIVFLIAIYLVFIMETCTRTISYDVVMDSCSTYYDRIRYKVRGFFAEEHPFAEYPTSDTQTIIFSDPAY
jgi:hypothetical protein